MAQPHPDASARSDEQVAEERAGHNARLALDDAVKSLEVARQRLQQDAYFAGDDLRLI